MTKVLHIGNRFTPKDETAKVNRRGNKLERRLQRRRALRASSTVERAIAEARANSAEVTNLATNSHEAKRYAEAARRERQGAK